MVVFFHDLIWLQKTMGKKDKLLPWLNGFSVRCEWSSYRCVSTIGPTFHCHEAFLGQSICTHPFPRGSQQIQTHTLVQIIRPNQNQCFLARYLWEMSFKEFRELDSDVTVPFCLRNMSEVSQGTGQWLCSPTLILPIGWGQACLLSHRNSVSMAWQIPCSRT